MTKLRVVLLLLLLIAAAGCRESAQATPTPSENVQIDLQVDDLNVGETSLLITLTDAQGNPIEDAQVAVRGDMDHAGMMPVIREPEDVTTDAPGQYRVPFEWTMGGGWIVTVTATLPDDTVVTKDFDLSVES